MNTNEMISVAIIEPVGGHGGMDYYDYGLAKGLSENGAEVYFYTCFNTKERFSNDIKTFYTFKNVWIRYKIVKLFTFIGGFLSSYRHAKKNKVDLIHLHFFDFSVLYLIILLLTSFFHFKVIVTLHDIDSFVGKSSKLIGKFCLIFIDGIIIHNETSCKEVMNKFNKIPKIAIIPHGNYCYFVDKLPSREINDKINLLFFGQIKEVKGLDILLKAFSKALKTNNNLHLTVAGRPWKTDKGYYLEMIENLGISEFVDTNFSYIKDEDVRSYYQNSDLVILPYRRIYQSGVILLTMSYGRACLTSDLSAFSEIIVNGNNGLMFKTEDIDDLAKHLSQLSVLQLKKIEHEAYLHVKNNFSWNMISQRTIKFYQDILYNL